MTVREFYDGIGGDYNGAIAVFHDDARLMRFLAMFTKDPAMESLKKAVEVQDWKSAFMAAHTLKGTAGNMRFARLTAAASELTEALRGNKPLEDESLYTAVCEAYDCVYQGLISCTNG